MLSALSRRDDDIEYRMFYCAGGTMEGRLPFLDNRFSARRWPVSDRVMNTIWHRARVPLPVQYITGAFDVFHSPDFTLPPAAGRPRIVTVHDLAFMTVPECAFPSLRTYLSRVVPRSIRQADHVLSVSESTKRDIIRLLDVSPDHVTTVPEAADPRFVPGDQEAARQSLEQFGISEPFILAVGTLEPRKNYERLLIAYARMRERGCFHKLVIVGARGWMFEPIFRRVETLDLSNHVAFLHPPDDALPDLYRAADAFVYPSLYEGFGLPPLEALACGTPTACSQSSSLPEVVGNAAITFDPLDADQIYVAIDRLLSDSVLRTQLKNAGPIQARKFSW